MYNRCILLVSFMENEMPLQTTKFPILEALKINPDNFLLKYLEAQSTKNPLELFKQVFGLAGILNEHEPVLYFTPSLITDSPLCYQNLQDAHDWDIRSIQLEDCNYSCTIEELRTNILRCLYEITQNPDINYFNTFTLFEKIDGNWYVLNMFTKPKYYILYNLGDLRSFFLEIYNKNRAIFTNDINWIVLNNEYINEYLTILETVEVTDDAILKNSLFLKQAILKFNLTKVNLKKYAIQLSLA